MCVVGGSQSPIWPECLGVGLELPPHQEIAPSWERSQELVGYGFGDIRLYITSSDKKALA